MVLPRLAPVTLPAAFALAARAFGIDGAAALAAYLWSWLENQVLCAIKTVPLGQVGGQRMLLALGARIPPAAATARAHRRRRARQFRAGSRAGVVRATRRSTLDCSAPDSDGNGMKQPLRVGIGGPVGSGKTALTLCSVPGAARALRDRGRHQRHLHRGGRAVPGAQRGARAGAHHRRRDRRLPAHRDPRGRVDQSRGGRRGWRSASAISTSSSSKAAATISPRRSRPELSDLTLYVIDVAAGDKIPRKGGPGITRSDLLVINKIDLAPMVGASLEVMDTRRAAHARRAPVRVHQPQDGAGARRGRALCRRARDGAVAGESRCASIVIRASAR